MSAQKKGAFPQQWEDCALLSEARQIYSKICAHCAQIAASQHLCVSPPPAPERCFRSVLVNLGYCQSGVGLPRRWARPCGRMPSQKAGAEPANRGGGRTGVRAGAVLDAAVDPALQQIQSDSRNWVKCDHYSRPPLPLPLPSELNRASGVII